MMISKVLFIEAQGSLVVGMEVCERCGFEER